MSIICLIKIVSCDNHNERVQEIRPITCWPLVNITGYHFFLLYYSFKPLLSEPQIKNFPFWLRLLCFTFTEIIVKYFGFDRLQVPNEKYIYEMIRMENFFVCIINNRIFKGNRKNKAQSCANCALIMTFSCSSERGRQTLMHALSVWRSLSHSLLQLNVIINVRLHHNSHNFGPYFSDCQ